MMLQRTTILTTPAVSFSPAQQAVLKTIAYFDIFQYPVTKEEIRNFSGTILSLSHVEAALSELQDSKIIFFHGGFFSLQDNPLLVYRRRQGNERAAVLLQKASRIGRFLQRFPFVRAVGVSGSLSKNFADQKADIDFFIITKSNRLWIARTWMHLFKKLTFITGRQHYYCMNYYIDENALELEEQNVFTAMELKTLLPVGGQPAMDIFFEANTWADNLLPSCINRRQENKDGGINWFKRSIEWCLSGSVGAWLDNVLLSLTARRWEKKKQSGKKNEKGLAMGLITKKHYAKSNPGNFQEKVLSAYEERLTTIFQFDTRNQL
jgi:hypothetical protein